MANPSSAERSGPFPAQSLRLTLSAYLAVARVRELAAHLRTNWHLPSRASIPWRRHEEDNAGSLDDGRPVSVKPASHTAPSSSRLALFSPLTVRVFVPPRSSRSRRPDTDAPYRRSAQRCHERGPPYSPPSSVRGSPASCPRRHQANCEEGYEQTRDSLPSPHGLARSPFRPDGDTARLTTVRVGCALSHDMLIRLPPLRDPTHLSIALYNGRSRNLAPDGPPAGRRPVILESSALWRPCGCSNGVLLELNPRYGYIPPRAFPRRAPLPPALASSPRPSLRSSLFPISMHIFFTCPAMSPPQASARRAPVYDDLAMLDPEVLRDADNISPSVSASRAQLPPPLATTPAYPYDDLVLVMLDQNERFILHASVCPASFTVVPTACLSLRCSRRCTSIARYLFPALRHFFPRRRPPPPKPHPLPHFTRRASPLLPGGRADDTLATAALCLAPHYPPVPLRCIEESTPRLSSPCIPAPPARCVSSIFRADLMSLCETAVSPQPTASPTVPRSVIPTGRLLRPPAARSPSCYVTLFSLPVSAEAVSFSDHSCTQPPFGFNSTAVCIRPSTTRAFPPSQPSTAADLRAQAL
ncbi:hypothetical protein DFH06DRAFT_1326066 [Mycena polygramma]|nr:hypothetical protein DFH06DRAFT_1326066 [Mycena polygramma]